MVMSTIGLVARNHGDDIKELSKSSSSVSKIYFCYTRFFVFHHLVVTWWLRDGHIMVKWTRKSIGPHKLKNWILRPKFSKTWEPTIKEPTTLPITPKKRTNLVNSQPMKKLYFDQSETVIFQLSVVKLKSRSVTPMPNVGLTIPSCVF